MQCETTKIVRRLKVFVSAIASKMIKYDEMPLECQLSKKHQIKIFFQTPLSRHNHFVLDLLCQLG